MQHDRPNPDAILARVQAESARAERGKLKIFFGYAAGVGKTFEMLSAAQREVFGAAFLAGLASVAFTAFAPRGRLSRRAEERVLGGETRWSDVSTVPGA